MKIVIGESEKKKIPKPLNGNGHDKEYPRFTRYERMNKKIVVQVWLTANVAKRKIKVTKANDDGTFTEEEADQIVMNGRDKLVGTKTVRVGTEYVNIRNRRYQIDYNQLKEGKKSFVYDTSVSNAIGCLSFHEYPDLVNPSNAYKMEIDTAVDTYVKKGGIPMLYLLIAILGMVVGIGISAYMSIQYVQAQDTIKAYETEYQKLLTENKNLKEQVITVR